MSYTGVVGAEVNVLFPSLARAKSEAFHDPGKQRRFRWEEGREGRGVGRSVTRTEWGGPMWKLLPQTLQAESVPTEGAGSESGTVLGPEPNHTLGHCYFWLS